MVKEVGENIINGTKEIAESVKDNKAGAIFTIAALSIGGLVGGVVWIAGKAIDTVAGLD